MRRAHARPFNAARLTRTTFGLAQPHHQRRHAPPLMPDTSAGADRGASARAYMALPPFSAHLFLLSCYDYCGVLRFLSHLRCHGGI